MLKTDAVEAHSLTGETDIHRAARMLADLARGPALLTEEACPTYRTGWTDFAEQLELCRKLDLDYVIVEATRFRTEPEATLAALCPRLGLSFEPGMLHWDIRDALPPGSRKRHSIWYARANASTGVLPPVEHVPPLERFPARIRPHLREALATYELAITDPRCL